MKTTFTSESVTEGHPDKMADQISDAVLDAMLEGDPTSRVACETLLTTGLVVVAGEVTTTTYVDIAAIVRDEDFGEGQFVVKEAVALGEPSDAVEERPQLQLERRGEEAGQQPAHHLGVEPDLGDRPHDADAVGRI